MGGRKSEEDGPAWEGENMHVLVVEDDEPVATFVREGLESDQFTVDVACDGEQARSLLDEADFDLVILDLVLPEVDGFEVLNHTRTRKPFLPVLIVSGWASVEDRLKGLDLGASDYLAKPFALRELSARVWTLLRRSPPPRGVVRQVEEYRRLFAQIKLALGLPPTFGLLVEANGPYSRGHSEAVSWLAMQITQQGGLSGVEGKEIRMAGLVHDIGKVHVPLHVLDKSAPLTPEEFDLVKSHAAIGEKMSEPLGGKSLARIVRHHHGTYDGTGYRDRLTGDRLELKQLRNLSKICSPSCPTRVPVLSRRLLPNCAGARVRNSTLRL